MNHPRIHFSGIARIHAPTGTGNRIPVVDTSTHTVYWDGKKVDPAVPPARFHEWFGSGERFNAKGEWDDEGEFSWAQGRDFGGNGHFAFEDVRVTSVQSRPGESLESDSLIGSNLDLWGHFNPYLGTTFNRARWIDGDPASDRSALIMAGRFSLGRKGPSWTGEPYALTGECSGFALSTWQHARRFVESPSHVLAEELSTSRLFRIPFPRDELSFLEGKSEFLSEFGEWLRERPEVSGLCLQFSLFNPSVPRVPNAPGFCSIVGSLIPYFEEEPRVLPPGRILEPDTGRAWGGASVTFSEDTRGRWASLYLGQALPFTRRRDPDRQGELVARPELPPAQGDLLLLAGEQVIAALDQDRYRSEEFWKAGGFFDLRLRDVGPERLKEDRLSLRFSGENRPVAIENEWQFEADQRFLYLEHSWEKDPARFDRSVQLRAFYRGKYHESPPIHYRAETNSNGFVSPAQREDPPCCLEITRTDNRLLIRGIHGGCGRIVFSPDGRFGEMETAGELRFRVLPNDWRLIDVPEDQVTFRFLYENVLHPYELLYPFMREAVFSLEDECKCETYARLMWQMCDPEQFDRTYYMPPTRELSYPKALLFQKYLNHVEKIRTVETVSADQSPHLRPLASRSELIRLLRIAVAAEVTIMLQYVFAAYSLPGLQTALALERTGRWTSAQRRLVCGEGDERLAQGWRGTLLEIAHEEMIHFLIINNLLMALGEPFSAGTRPDGSLMLDLPVDSEFALEPFSLGSVNRFVKLEWPLEGVRTLTSESEAGTSYHSLAELYRVVRLTLEAHPEWFESDGRPRGGEHHLFLNRSTDHEHPDFQFQVFDGASAIFALDFVTGQGESGTSPDPSHYIRFRTILEQLLDAQKGFPPWEPAYPVLKNPSIRGSAAGMNEVKDPKARRVMEFFNENYWMSMSIMSLHFQLQMGETMRRSRLMNASIDFMTGLMRPVGILLMTLPSGVKGRTAGPSFELPRALPVFEDYAEACRYLSAESARLRVVSADLEESGIARAQTDLLGFYERHFADLAAGRITRFA